LDPWQAGLKGRHGILGQDAQTTGLFRRNEDFCAMGGCVGVNDEDRMTNSELKVGRDRRGFALVAAGPPRDRTTLSASGTLRSTNKGAFPNSWLPGFLLNNLIGQPPHLSACLFQPTGLFAAYFVLKAS
jgi:hypothetical protein